MAWDFEVMASILLFGTIFVLSALLVIMVITIHKDDCDRWDVLGAFKIEGNDSALLKTTTYQCLIGNVSSVVCNCSDTWLKNLRLP